MASDDQIKARKDLIKHLASLPEQEAADEINIEAAFLAGNNGEQAISAETDKLKQELTDYQVISFDKVAGVFTNNSMTATTTFDEQGIAGQTYKVQQQVPFFKDAGAIWANGSVNFDSKGNVSGGAVGVNYVGVPGTVHGVDYVAIANANVSIPKNGEVTPENASFLLGGILKLHDPNATNLTLAAITNGAGSEVSLYGRASKPLYSADGLTVTGFEENVYGIKSGNLDASAGVRIDKDLGNGFGVYAQGSASVANVNSREPNVTGQLTGGGLWGGGEKKSVLTQNLVAATAKQEPSRISSEGLKNGLDAAATVYATLSADSKGVLVKHIAENLLPVNTFNTAEDARNYVTNELNSRTQPQDPGQSPGG